jgi:AraC-like DNA-binding protein
LIRAQPQATGFGKNGGMDTVRPGALDAGPLWKLARGGDFRGAGIAAQRALSSLPAAATARRRVELHLVAAFCSMRQGHHAEALAELHVASGLAASPRAPRVLASRVDAWRAELAYFQGRYSDAENAIEALLPRLTAQRDWQYVAFALRTRIAILLARTDYDGAGALAQRAITAAEASADDYVLVQVLNVLGAVEFDRATAKLKAPHARAHLSSLDRDDAIPLEENARAALRLFQRARAVAERGGYAFAAWYVAGNIERLEILLGHADRAIRPIRKRLRILQSRGATYDEIVARSNLAWALRTLGRHREALHELDVAFGLARDTGTANVLLEFLEYDRSIVLDGLGDASASRASYRRYLQLVGAGNAVASASAPGTPSSAPRRPLEPYFLKRADRFIAEHLRERFTVGELATHCGVSWRTLEKVFSELRGVTPVAYVRNLRLDEAHRALTAGPTSVADVARSCGFGSSTTFALEYRRRFGVSPRQSARGTPA